MSTYNEIDIAVCQPFQSILLLLGRFEAVELLHPHAEVGKAGACGVVVLFGKYGAGAHYGGLLAAKHAEVCSAQRDFRLTVAHVAAQQPVHYLVGAHIRLDFGYGAELVGSFFILEGILELLHHDSVFGEAVALLFAPLGIQLLQVERHLFY